MGLIVLLQFALLCIDFLAWPVIALGYPLFASIRAIETGSLYQLRKLVIYWTIFSIISLFEYALVKVIEWIPFWSSIKLVAIFWLVIPRFHGAYYAYQSLIRPFLVVNLQQAIDSLYKRKEEQTREKERFLDVVERYIKENGSEDLEKVIASNVSYTMGLKELGNFQKDTQVITEPDEKNVVAASDKLNKTIDSQKDKEILEAYKKIAVKIEAETHARPVAAVWVPKETTTYAAAKTKDVTATEPISENRHLTTTQKAEPEWTCPLCQVATTCESNLNDHLRGKKHKSMCESLKSSKLSVIGPSSTAKPSLEAGKSQVWRRIRAHEENGTRLKW